MVALFEMIATGGGSGVEITRERRHRLPMDAGEIVRMEYFNDQAKALEAAGLSE